MQVLRVIGSFDLPSLAPFYAQRTRYTDQLCSVELYSASLVGKPIGQEELDAWSKGYDTSRIHSFRAFLHDEYTRFLPEDMCTPWTYRENLTRGIWTKSALAEIMMVEKQRLIRAEALEEQAGAE